MKSQYFFYYLNKAIIKVPTVLTITNNYIAKGAAICRLQYLTASSCIIADFTKSVFFNTLCPNLRLPEALASY
jgi:hypothetical protein